MERKKTSPVLRAREETRRQLKIIAALTGESMLDVLDRHNEQRTACLKHAGASRFAYNWGLSCCIEVYRTTGKRPSPAALHKELVRLKQTDYPWMYEVSKCAIQEALRDLDAAYKHFFRRLALKKQGLFKGKVGFPQFKK